ncbi:glycosyltransferase [uncultured Methylobacterium sp.]|uniref:glycosyltransferase n=1 Tax=uncultured Methylobacterium sp. TaxID=157278 RepID=UPI0035CA91BC
MRVLIAVTHLLGAGHLTRAAALAHALAGAGHDVTLVSGGTPAPLVRTDGVRRVQLPPLHVAGTAFGRLLDSEGREAGTGLLDARTAILRATLAGTAPDVVVTELFPFGRRALAGEFSALVAAAAGLRPKPLILASIRDVLVAPDRPEKVRAAHARIEASYDAVMVHGDPDLVPLDASWPVDASLRAKLRYTGYIDAAASPGGPNSPGAGILVSAGSSAAGLALCRIAAEAARLRPDLGWRILAGHGIPEPAFLALGEGLAEGVLARARPDYRALLARAAVSVSACGYNTAVDLLATRTRAVLVPFEGARETEQRLRAERLAARGLARVLAESTLTAESLLDAVAIARAAPAPPPHGIGCDGAARAVAIVETLLAARRRGRRAGPDGFGRLREALDAAGGCGIAVPVWWRDDDAVAASPALDRLLGLAAAFDAPILVAAIPAGLAPSLGARLRDAPRASLAVHGLAHANHAALGAKAAEFGAGRPLPALVADAAEALRLARERMPAEALLPVFVPPWNRLAPALAAALPGLGYAGLSAVPGGAPVAGLVRADVHVDPIDWRGTRSLADPDTLVETLCRELARGSGRPIGILTHHLAQDDAVWGFLADLFAVLLRHPAVTVADPRHLFRAPAVDEAAPSCSTPAPGRHARVA